MIIYVIIALLLFLLFPIGIYKNSIFLASFSKGMELTNQDVYLDTLKYKDSNRPIYYDFVPEVEPML